MKYSERAKKAKEERNLKIPGGRFEGPFKSFECKPNGAGNLMMTVGIVPASCHTPEVLEKDPDIIGKLLNKKKEARLYMTMHNPKSKFNPHAGFETQLEILLDAGYDVDQCRPFEEDPNYEDFKSLWHQMLALSPQVVFDVKWDKEDDQFPKVRIVEIKPHPTTLAQKAQSMDQATQAVATGITPPPPVTTITKSQLRAAGWTDEQINASEHANAPEV